MRQEIFSNELKKQAWEKMNEILDKELPQKKRKLRFLLILFPIFLIAGFVLFKSVYANNSGEKKIESGKTEKIPFFEKNERKSHYRIKNNSNIPVANKGTYKNKKHVGTISNELNTLENTVEQSIETQNDISLNPETITSVVKEKSTEENLNFKREDVLTGQIPNHIVFQENNKITPKKFLLNPLDIHNLKTQNIWYFHPYCGIKLYNSAVNGLNLSSEINVGNLLILNNRFLLDFSFSYTNPKILYSTVEVFDNNYDVTSKLNEFANESSQITNLQSIKYSIFEFSFHESYKLSRVFTISAGGGIALTKKMNSLLRNEENYPSEYVEVDLIRPVTFLSDINLQYYLNKKINFLLGYKYYFKNYSVFKDLEAVALRSAYLKKESELMNLYLGVRYNFK